jgi:hypothetical protein
MKKSHAYLSILTAAMFASAGVYAQTAPTTANTDGPPKAGEASTQTMGVPNAKTTNSPVGDGAAAAPPRAVETQSMGAAAATTSVPATPGAAATVAIAPHALTRQEVVNDLLTRRARFEAMRGSMRG